MIVPLANSRTLRNILLLTILSVIGVLNKGCSSKSTSHYDAETNRQSSENAVKMASSSSPTNPRMSKRCDSKDYSDIHDDLDKECFRLQERLITAALDGNINLLREALKDGANPDGTYLERGPALHMAAMKGYSDLVRELLDNNAQINREVPFQQTPLIMATYHGRSDVVRILLSRGADVCFKTLEGTADEIAQKKDYGEIAELLKVAKKQKCKAW